MTPKDASSPVCPSKCPHCCLNMDFASRWKDRRLNGVLAQSQRETIYLAVYPIRLWVSGRQDCFLCALQHYCLALCRAPNKRLGTWVTVDITAENNFAIFVLPKNTWVAWIFMALFCFSRMVITNFWVLTRHQSQLPNTSHLTYNTVSWVGKSFDNDEMSSKKLSNSSLPS